MNRIVGISITLMDNGSLDVAVTKEFAPENGGGRQTFHEAAPGWHAALDRALGMVTVSPRQRTDGVTE